MAATQKVHMILTKYFIYINRGHYVIYLQNIKFERLILWPEGAYTDAMHRFIHESWLYRLIGMYPKWAKKHRPYHSLAKWSFIWNPPVLMKSTCNLVDFMKSGGFHGWEVLNQITQANNFTSQRARGGYVIWTLWNPPDFMKSAPKSTLCKKMRFRALTKYRSFVYTYERLDIMLLCFYE